MGLVQCWLMLTGRFVLKLEDGADRRRSEVRDLFGALASLA